MTRLLLDSGSTLSLIKLNAWKEQATVYPQFKRILTGIGKDTVETKGTCYIGLKIGRKVYIQLFNVVANDVLDASIDGRVGNDFLKFTRIQRTNLLCEDCKANHSNHSFIAGCFS